MEDSALRDTTSVWRSVRREVGAKGSADRWDKEELLKPREENPARKEWWFVLNTVKRWRMREA